VTTVSIRFFGVPEDRYERSPYHDDVVRIQRVLRERGWDATYQQAEGAWDAYSDDVEAIWMDLPKTDDCLYERVRGYIEAVD